MIAPLGRRLWAVWPARAVDVEVPADLETDLRQVRDDLRLAAAERGWEPPEPDDLFARLRRLEEELRRNGCEDTALQLAEAVAVGSTGTEILMRVRWTLQSEEVRGATMTPSLAAAIETALAEVNALLST